MYNWQDQVPKNDKVVTNTLNLQNIISYRPNKISQLKFAREHTPHLTLYTKINTFVVQIFRKI